jgi:DNA polymerase-3 subunit epsilon
LHGALLDAELLADVFLAMSRGQNSFAIEIEESAPALQIIEELTDLSKESILILSASELELSEHESSIKIIDKELKGLSIWSAIEG